jgi:hypothetical protein
MYYLIQTGTGRQVTLNENCLSTANRKKSIAIIARLSLQYLFQKVSDCRL